MGSQHGRSFRPLADAPGLRQVLRVPRRRDQPVGAVPLRRHRRRRAAERPELPLHDRHDRQGAGLDQVPEGPDAGHSLVRLLRPGRDARAAPCPERLDCPLEGQVRSGLGQDPRRDPGAPDPDGHRARRDEAGAQAARHQGLGRALGGREAPVHPAGRGVRGVRRVHRLRDRPHARRLRGSRPGRQHAGVLHRRRQRHQRRRRDERHVQRVPPTSMVCRRRPRTC